MFLQNVESAECNVLLPDCGKDISKRYDIPEGLTRTKRRNYKKQIREKEKKYNAANEVAKHSAYMNDPLQAQRSAVLTEILEEFRLLPMFSEMKPADVLQFYSEQQRLLNDMLTRLTNAQENLCNSIPTPNNRRLTSAMLLDRIKKTTSLPEVDNDVLEDLKTQLTITVSWENARKSRTSFDDCKKKIEDRILLNRKLVEGIRHKEKLQNMAYRITALKARLSNPPDVQLVMQNIKVVTCDLNFDFASLLTPPNSITHKVERLFFVVLERLPSQGRKRSYQIYGCPDDILAFSTFSSSVPWSSPVRFTLPQQTTPYLMGKGGRELRQLEDTFQCILDLKPNGDMVIYSTKDKAEEIQQRIKSIKVEKPLEPLVTREIQLPCSEFGRALISTFSQRLRRIETEMNVTIRVAAPQKLTKVTGNGNAQVISLPFGGDCTTVASREKEKQNKQGQQIVSGEDGENVGYNGVVSIRGRIVDQVEQATRTLTELVEAFVKLTIPVHNDTLNSLFAYLGGRSRVVTRLETSGLTAPFERFKILFDLYDDQVAMMQEPSVGIVLVGPEASCSELKPQLEDIVQKAAYEPVKLRVPAEVATVCCSAVDMHGLEQKHNVTLRKTRTSQTPPLIIVTVVGIPENANAAAEELKTVIDERGQVLTLTITDPVTLKQLSRVQIIRAFERKHGIRMFFKQGESTVTCVGSQEALNQVQHAITQLHDLPTTAALDSKKQSFSQNKTHKQTTSISSSCNASHRNIADIIREDGKASESNQEDFDVVFPSLSEAVEAPQPTKHGRRRRIWSNQASAQRTPSTVTVECNEGNNVKCVDDLNASESF